MWLPFLTGFLAGFLCLAVAEICAIGFLLRPLLRARHRRASTSPASNVTVTYQPPQIFLQGDMWVAAVPACISKKDTIKVMAQREKNSKDHWKRKDSGDECIETYPTRRRAQLQNNVLTLVAENGSEERIKMQGCSVLSVSGGQEMARKWAKKYPLQLETFNQNLVVNSSVCLLYFETSWEKETWCQVLRAAAKWTTEKENWYIAQKKKFHDYCLRFDEAYPTLAKAIGCKSNKVEDERTGKLDRITMAALSKKQKIWRKITKKTSSKESAFLLKEASVGGDPNSSLVASKSVPEQLDEQLKQPCLMSQPLEGSVGLAAAGSLSLRSNRDNISTEDSQSLSDSSKSLEYQSFPDLLTIISDQGTMCWNLICSRLFYDVYQNLKFQEACQRLIQKQFSKIVTPSYIGKITCTKVDLGSVPPIIHSMQALPKGSDFIWAFDAVIEYSGGAQLKIDTRLDVRDSVSQEKVLDQSLQPTLAGAAAADILRAGLETIGRSADTSIVHSTDTEAGSEKTQASRGRWRTMLSRVADQVSLVPITLSMKLVSFKGTIRVRIKPSPTDRIWFGFTSMPLLDFQPMPSIGEHKITTGPIIAFITNRIKMLIQDTLVLPNSEGLWVPWMISETDDWIPQTARPVPWSPTDTRDSLPREDGLSIKDSSLKTGTDILNPSKNRTAPVLEESDELLELKKPLLEHTSFISGGETSSLKDARSSAEQTRLQNTTSKDWEDANRVSRRAKMLNLGKKVSEKLDEKRRLVVERMREGLEKYEQGEK